MMEEEEEEEEIMSGERRKQNRHDGGEGGGSREGRPRQPAGRRCVGESGTQDKATDPLGKNNKETVCPQALGHE